MFVSERLLGVVEPLLKKYELISLHLRTSGPNRTQVGQAGETRKFFWLNTWNRLNLVDIDRSKFAETAALRDQTGRATKISAWEQLVIKPDWPADEHLFGIEQLYNQKRYCSVEFYERCRAAQLAVNFRPLPLDRSSGVNQRVAKYSEYLLQSKLPAGEIN